MEKLRVSDPAWTEEFVRRLSSLRGKAITAKDYPNVPVDVFLDERTTAKEGIFTLFFQRLLA